MAEQIEIIRSKKKLIDRSKTKNDDKLRVAAYCRVSTDSEEQISSYKSQVKYYNDLIYKNDEWIMVDIYSDEAVTGTSIEKRQGFQKLINDCLNGKIDLIVTKSISRFARNTLDTLKYVRMLKEKNIAVMFEDEKINTMTMDGELLLVVLSSVAQQEVENISANVKKGLKMKMQRGELVGYNGCLGYDYNKKTKTISINEEEAETVRYIFNRYNEGAGCSIIAKELRQRGITGRNGNTTWHESTIRCIIRNEKYIGDLLLGKTFTVDPISKRRLKNFGEEDKFYLRNHHEPIVSKAVFYQAQEILKQRSGSRVLGEAYQRKKFSRQFDFSCMLKCGFCGNSLARRAWNSGSEYEKIIWHCVVHTNKGSKYCPNSKGIKETLLEEAFLESYKLICKDNEGTIDEFLGRVCDILEQNKKKNTIVEKFINEKDILVQRKNKLLDTMLDGKISSETFDSKINEIEESILELDYQINIFTDEISEANDYENRINTFRRILVENRELKEFDRAVFESVINCILIGGYDENEESDPTLITFVYKAGISKSELFKEKDKRERIIIANKYADDMCDKKDLREYDRLNNIPQMVELFSFDFPYEHMVFNKLPYGGTEKILKKDCKIKVAIAI